MANALLNIQRKNRGRIKVVHVVLFHNHFNQLIAHHQGENRRRNGDNDRFRTGFAAWKNAAVPVLRSLPTSDAISPTLVFTVLKRPDRFPLIPSIRMPLIHSPIKSSIMCVSLLPRPPSSRRGAAYCLQMDSNDYPSSPDSSGTRVMPMRATPPPATSCFDPLALAGGGLSAPYPSNRLTPPHTQSAPAQAHNDGL